MPDAMARLTTLYPASARPRSVPTALGSAGGGSGARLWRFESGVGPLVARAWPPDGPGPDALRAIHARLAALGDLDFVPVPLATLDGRTLVPAEGRWWEVAPWCPGVAEMSRPPGSGRLRAASAGLAAVHQRWALTSVIATSPGLRARLAEVQDWLGTDLGRLEALVAHETTGTVVGLARRWLAIARDGLSRVAGRLRREASEAVTIQPIVRDARPEHFLFTGDRLTGLVDFGAMGVDDPAADLARLLGEWVGDDPGLRAEALTAYASIRPLGPGDFDRIVAFEESAAWLGPARWLRWEYLDRRPFADPEAVTTGLDRAMRRLIERIGPGAALLDPGRSDTSR